MNLLSKMIFVITTENPDDNLIQILEKIRLQGNESAEIIIASTAETTETNGYIELAKNNYRAKVFETDSDRTMENLLLDSLTHAYQEYKGYDGLVAIQANKNYTIKELEQAVQRFYVEEKALIFASKGENKNDTLDENTGASLLVLPNLFLKDLAKIEQDLLLNEANLALMAAKQNFETVKLSFHPDEGTHSVKAEDKGQRNPIVKFLDYNSMILRFIISSVTTFIIDNSLFTMVLALFTTETFIAIVSATAVGRVISSVVNYLMNRYFVFQGSSGNSGIKYFSLVVIKLIASSILVSFVNSLIPAVHTTILKIVVDGVLFALSYAIQKKYIFGEEVAD